MHPQLAALGDGSNGTHLFHRVHGANLGRLRQRHHLGLGIVNVRAARHQRFHRIGRELAVGARRGQQLGAVGEKLRAATLVGLDMRQFMADHRMVGLAQRGQRQRVRRGAVEDEEHFAIGLEQVADPVADFLRPRIVAIGLLVAAAVGFEEILERFRTEAGVVVGGEMLHREIRGGGETRAVGVGACGLWPGAGFGLRLSVA